MSNWYQKIEYTCECGHNYGSCGEVGKFFLKYQGVSDHFMLYHQAHPNEKVRELIVMTDESFCALAKMLETKYEDRQQCTPEEVSLLK